MTTHGASLPGGSPPGQDRWTVTPHGIVVLDGATAVAPDVPPAEKYVDHLLAAISQRLDATRDLTAVVAEAIDAVATELQLHPGGAPSSTVAVLRWTGTHVDSLALGDSTIVLGLADGSETRLRDDRLAAVAPTQRDTYRRRLESGHGYDGTHRQILSEIQSAEIAARNSEMGYWIAEADPAAARHSVARRDALTELRWAVLATDGAQRPIDHLELPWADVAARDSDALGALLHDLHRWETHMDPDGRALPRAKRHDDKAVVTWAADHL
ncbi:hypothetical protein [Pseudonocardia phyllosphaerae]|uniref:hypothetical protein n=1 Tax=Pseudonocardia phyllosphaerae TaxID=3390502 RepID=UPI003978310F